MSLRKRSVEALEAHGTEATASFLSQLRNMWEFANLCQWIYLFGKAAKIDNSIDVEELETECLKPSSTVLDDIALAILKLVSSHRGLTLSIFDDQARKQYLALAPLRNPFGNGDDPNKFSNFDVFTKIRVMQQLTQWSMRHPERIREKMDEQRDIEQTEWVSDNRIEPYGWDSKDRTYYVLDDNRVYRLTEAPTTLQPFHGKKTSSRNRRQSNKRRRSNRSEVIETDDENADNSTTNDNGLGGMTWECIAVTLGDVQNLLQGLKKTRDKNEQILRQQLEDHLLPILERQEEARKRKEMQREKELLNLAKMANAKRSSRIAGKAERQKQEESAKEEEERIKTAELARKREEEKHLKLEQQRDLRLASREQRLREREARRLQHEEELATLSEDSLNVASGKSRMSERQRHVEISKNREALKHLDDEEDWVFDCVCGMYGHVDDGTHSVSCEKCNIWQHSKCLGISEEDADRPDFHFVCTMCHRREDIVNGKAKTTIKLRVSHADDSATPQVPLEGTKEQKPRSSLVVELPARTPYLDEPASPAKQAMPRPVEKTSDTGGGTEPTAPTSFRDTIQISAEEAAIRHGDSKIFSPIPAAADVSLTAAVTPLPNMNKRQVEPLVSPLLENNHGQSQGTGTPALYQSVGSSVHATPRKENNGFPIRAGISPTKQSPRPMSPATAGLVGPKPSVYPPVTLSPSPHEIILTPPVKSSPPRPGPKEV
ncbi:hypothetical protein HJFPF1_01394 [Paramyrothecium foliicola]|nr:hypothetical protein HJFPF1_01394 [Paramyrothecium foliicola]